MYLIFNKLNQVLLNFVMFTIKYVSKHSKCKMKFL
jgi:hypothetical protein